VNNDIIKENDSLRSMLADKAVSETIIKSLNLNGSGLSMQLEGGAAQVMAEAFAEQFIESGAENYLEVSFGHTKLMPGENLVVTIQRVDGKTPHAFRQIAENQIKALKRRVAELEGNG